MKEIDHPALIQEWKINLYTAAYPNKPEKKRLWSKEEKNRLAR